METVHLITSCQVRTARNGLQCVAEFIGTHTCDELLDPDYAYTRARALDILDVLIEEWRHLPSARTIGVG